MNLVLTSVTRREYIPVGSAPAPTAMDGGNAENAGAFFCLRATVTTLSTRFTS
ncbi:MAG: hypothetical protein IIB78_05520 [Proteobacteria bacterium]|nr:hypothetical protein [Pseudomonadota bacterium]MCH8174445.1 hypothetical protein [Pseudomonadota bacterium]